MKRSRGWLVAALCALLLLPMAQGCRQKTPEDIFQDALANMERVESMHMSIAMRMEMRVMGQDMNMRIGAEGDIASNPVKGSMEMWLEVGAMSMRTPMYYEQQGDAFMTYVGMEEGSGVEWYRQRAETAPISDGMLTADALEGFEYIDKDEYEALRGASHEQPGNEEPGELLHYRGMIDAEQIKGLLEASTSGGLDSLTGSDSALIGAVLEEIGKTEMIVTVDKKSGHIVRQEMDLGPMMRAILKKALENEQGAAMGVDLSSLIEIGEMPVVIEYSRFNEIGSIEIPAEALNGRLLEEGEYPTAA